MSKDGRAFIENTIAENVSRNGVRLTGLSCEVRKDEVLILSHQNRKGRFRVIWSRQHGIPPVFQVGLRALDLAQNIWAIDFSGREDECKPVERRAAQHQISGGVASISHAGTRCLLHGTVADLSLDGCYVEVAAPLNVDNRVILMPSLNAHDRVGLILSINGTEIRTAAEVRTFHPGMGMGLKFVDVAETDRARLRALIARTDYSGSGQIDVGAERRSGKKVPDIHGELDEPEVFPRMFEEWRNG
jgi:hypothetical protein